MQGYLSEEKIFLYFLSCCSAETLKFWKFLQIWNVEGSAQKWMIDPYCAINFEDTLDLSEINVNVITGNNEAYQRSPNDPVIQRWPFFFCPDPRFFYTSMKLSFASYIMSSIEVKKLGSGQKRKVIFEFLGHKENVGVLRCFRSWH